MKLKEGDNKVKVIDFKTGRETIVHINYRKMTDEEVKMYEPLVFSDKKMCKK